MMRSTGCCSVRLAAALAAISAFSADPARRTATAAALIPTVPCFASNACGPSRRGRGHGQAFDGPKMAAAKATPATAAASESAAASEEEEADGKKPAHAEQEPCNVVFTHTNADFDSLAAAVALSMLWRHEQPDLPTHVVLPRGVHPVVQRFLAFHKHLLPLRGFKTILADDVRAVGVVDAQSASRIGRGQSWLDKARSIHVFDHHDGDPVDGGGDKKKTLVDMATELVIDKVGSTTTLIVERLQAAGISPAPHEATLFALGIRADTGGLVYEGTTLRDARALLWCLEAGASQVAISEFGTARVSEPQRALLNLALRDAETETVHGLRVSAALVSLEDQYVAGLAQVSEELLELTDSDVFLLGATHRSGSGGGGNAGGKKSKKGGGNGDGATAAPSQQWVSLIGRASPRAVGVDLNAVMRSLGGGGHPKAAAAALRCEPPPQGGGGPGEVAAATAIAEAEGTFLEERLSLANAGNLTAGGVLAAAVGMVVGMIPEQLVASSFMVPAEKLVTLSTDDTASDAREIFHANGLKSAPVVDAETGRFRGSLKLNDLIKAVRSGRSDHKLRGMMRSSVETVLPDTPLAELEELLVNKGVGRLPVVDDDGVLIGIVTRTDVLRQHKLYAESDLDDIIGR